MARYSEKNEADLAWEEIRRAVTYRANLAAANAKSRFLNEILPRLQGEFEKSLSEGTLLQLSDGADELVERLEKEIRDA